MRRKRMNYGGAIMEHWSHGWLRWGTTVGGLWAFIALSGVIAIHQASLGIGSNYQEFEWTDFLLRLVLVVNSAGIARHLHTREREPGLATPDSSMHLMFSVALSLCVVAMFI